MESSKESTMPNDFFNRIEQFNAMYQMESTPVGGEIKRLGEFHRMLNQEVDEVNDIYDVLEGRTSGDAKVMMADWLGDMIVYCASEALRWQIPLEEVLTIIMDSNASKLQADGTAKFVAGKLQKGPGYWKPEPKIAQLLKGEE